MTKSVFGILTLGALIGILSSMAFHTSLEYTNTTEFCISCHEMKASVYEEYINSSHFSNHSGVKAECHDCHVPKSGGPKLLRKLYAVNDVYHWLLGSINTKEKFEKKREKLASRVWSYMKKSNSRECRSCHSWEAMEMEEQDRSAFKKHSRARETGETCIDCHKGIVHFLPEIE